MTLVSARALRRVLVDTSGYFALLNTRDAKHGPAKAVAERLADESVRQFTTNAILFETHALILTKIGRHVARRFLEDLLQSATIVVRVAARDEQRAFVLIGQYDDKNFSFTDALSFAVMERLRISTAFTFDRNFTQYGLAVLPKGGDA